MDQDRYEGPDRRRSFAERERWVRRLRDPIFEDGTPDDASSGASTEERKEDKQVPPAP
jgi:hypothetical protein